MMYELLLGGGAVGFAVGVVIGALCWLPGGARLWYIKVTQHRLVIFHASGLSPTRLARLTEEGPCHFLNESSGGPA